MPQSPTPPKPDLAARRANIAKALDLKDELLLVGAGEAIGIPGGMDQTYPFLAHSEYFYLTDEECEGGVVAFDPKSGWTDFVPEVTQAQRVWEGRTQVPGTPLPELAAWMAARRGRPIAMLGSKLPGITADAAKTTTIRDAFTHARRPKDAAEIARMKLAVAASLPGYAAARRVIAEAAAGKAVTERDVQTEMEAEFFRNGATRTCYSSLVGAGSNAAILHVDPSSRLLKPGDLVLIDAGAEVRRYGADVTRTYFCGPVDSVRQELYAIVNRAFDRAIAACTVGAEWLDVHFAAATDMADGLVQMGVLKGNATALVESDAAALFFPHGLGHLIGLGVRDASGRMPGRQQSTRPGLSKLRMDIPLGAGYTTTVEPGLYFIAALINDPENRTKHKDAVNWPLVDKLLASGIGGVRIEDNIHVTPAGPENLTGGIPRTIN